MMLDDSEASHRSTKLEPIKPAPPVISIVSGCIVVRIASAIILHFATFVRSRWQRGQERHLNRKKRRHANCASIVPPKCLQFLRPRGHPTAREFPSPPGEQAACEQLA